jgi:hypothetical protein
MNVILAAFSSTGSEKKIQQKESSITYICIISLTVTAEIKLH